jgi:hypothetical protein
VFNRHTGAALSTTSNVADSNDFFIAVGINRDGGNTLQDLNQSAGQFIQANGVTGYTLRNYSAALPKIVDITNFKIKCDTEYGIKVEFRNSAVYLEYGYTQFTKSWQAVSGCCTEDCVDCDAAGDCVELAGQLIDQINNDPDKLLLAQYIDYTTDPENPVVVAAADVAQWKEDNADLCLGIRLTSIPVSMDTYGSINLQYYNPRGTNILVMPNEGFACNVTTTTVQELKYEEGNGIDLQEMEYVAGGWNGKPGPYRVSEVTNSPRKGIEYFASATGKYHQLSLNYDLESQSNFRQYQNNLMTVLAVPCADTTATLAPLVAILDRILSNRMAPLASSVTGGDCVGDDRTSGMAAANNGIKILA